MNDLAIGTRVYCDAEGNSGTVVAATARTVFAEYGHPYPQPKKYETNKAFMARVRALHESCIVRGMPADFEGEPVDPDAFVAVKVDDDREPSRYWQISEIEVIN